RRQSCDEFCLATASAVSGAVPRSAGHARLAKPGGAKMTEDHALLSDVGLNSTGRRVPLASLFSALPLSSSSGRAQAMNSSETQVTVPDQIKWTAWPAGPPHGAEMATLFGGLDKPGEYVVLMR